RRDAGQGGSNTLGLADGPADQLLSRVPRSSSAWAGVFRWRMHLHRGKDPAVLPHSRSPLRLNLHRSNFTIQIVTKTAPNPILGPRNQTTLHRIAMNVTKLLHKLAFAPDIEIVVASLPE